MYVILNKRLHKADHAKNAQLIAPKARLEVRFRGLKVDDRVYRRNQSPRGVLFSFLLAVSRVGSW